MGSHLPSTRGTINETGILDPKEFGWYPTCLKWSSHMEPANGKKKEARQAFHDWWWPNLSAANPVISESIWRAWVDPIGPTYLSITQCLNTRWVETERVSIWYCVQIEYCPLFCWGSCNYEAKMQMHIHRLRNRGWLLRTPRGLDNHKKRVIKLWDCFRAYNRNSGTFTWHKERFCQQRHPDQKIQAENWWSQLLVKIRLLLISRNQKSPKGVPHSGNMSFLMPPRQNCYNED